MIRQPILALAVVVLLGGLSGSVWAQKYSGGTGEPNNPYRIGDANDMQQIGANPDDWDAHFVMVKDINLADYTGTQFNIVGNVANAFTGVFDGNDHTISNFTYVTDANGIGLFAYINDANAEIKDLTLIEPNVDGGTMDAVGSLVGAMAKGTVSGCGIQGGSVSGLQCTGALVGWNYQGTISNCYATAVVSGHYHTGGLVGMNYLGTIWNCYAGGRVCGEYSTGGVVGRNTFGEISACYATGAVHGNNYWTGGLVGWNEGTISDCYAKGSVDGNDHTGGLVGCNECTISDCSNCFATGDVTGNANVGGLVGLNEGGMISNCYATGTVDGNDYTGGLAGYHSLGTISNCYAATAVSGDANTGGLVGYNIAGMVSDSFWDVNTSGLKISDGGTLKTTAEMQTESTFTDAGWDFIEIWNIGENQTYPYLRIYPAGDLNHDGLVNMLDFAILADRWLEGAEP